MSNASELPFIYDTDALAQIFLSGQPKILSDLRDQFGVHSYLMSEVEVELLSNRRISGLVKPGYEKAVKNGLIKLLSASDLERISAESGQEVTLQEIRALAADLKLLVGIGEAHTHAAAILLKCPAVSNDGQALQVLEANVKPLPSNVLRAFDLFGFCFTEGLLSQSQVESIRSVLLNHIEGVPKAMKNSNFVDGLPHMRCRLSTSLAASGSTGGWSGTFYLQRRVRT